MLLEHFFRCVHLSCAQDKDKDSLSLSLCSLSQKWNICLFLFCVSPKKILFPKFMFLSSCSSCPAVSLTDFHPPPPPPPPLTGSKNKSLLKQSVCKTSFYLKMKKKTQKFEFFFLVFTVVGRTLNRLWSPFFSLLIEEEDEEGGKCALSPESKGKLITSSSSSRNCACLGRRGGGGEGGGKLFGGPGWFLTMGVLEKWEREREKFNSCLAGGFFPFPLPQWEIFWWFAPGCEAAPV